MAGDEIGTGSRTTGAVPVVQTPPRLDQRYEVTDRTGLSMGVLPLPTIHTMIRQGRLFRTDLVSKNGAAAVALGELPEFQGVLDDTLPPEFQVGGAVMRPRPDIAGQLDATALGGIFARLFQEGRTGRLFIAGPDRRQEKVVIFQRGVPVNAMSNIAEEQLGEVLIQHGLISSDTFQDAVQHRRVNPGRLGSALIAIDAMTPRDLHRALSIQAMERLLNAFRQQEGTFRFVPDETAADEEILLFASVREIIEAGLHASLGPAEVGAELAAFGDAPLAVRQEALKEAWGRALQPGDPEILAIAGAGKPVEQVVGEAARLLRLTTDEARLKILALTKFGVMGPGEVAARQLEDTLRRLESQHFFDALGLGRAATAAEVAAALNHNLDSLQVRPNPADPPVRARLKEKIRTILEAAARTLSDENLRPIYERALQLGLDFEQPEVRSRLEYEHNLNRGKQALTLQKPDEARRFFLSAAEAMPEEPMVYVHMGWAQFLASARDSNAAAAAVREVERALRLRSDLDAAHMTVGKIYRIAGEMELAEKHLRHAIALNPHNNEAQSELRLIFTRELDGRLPGQKKAALKLEAGLASTLGVYFAVFGLLLVLANFVGGPYAEYPDSVLPIGNHLLKVEKAIPQDKQVMGILESYYFLEDPMWWIRRGLLLFVGLLAMRFLVNRDGKHGASLMGTAPTWVAAAVPYGLAVGFFSPIQVTAEALPVTLAMTAFHVLAEQVFFIGFVFRSLSREFRQPLLSIIVTALLFGLYHVSYTAILTGPSKVLIQDVLQIGAFAGGAYAALFWRSGGMLAPFVGHLTVNAIMMIHSYGSLSGRSG